MCFWVYYLSLYLTERWRFPFAIGKVEIELNYSMRKELYDLMKLYFWFWVFILTAGDVDTRTGTGVGRQ